MTAGMDRQPLDEGRDFTKFIWIGIGVLFLVMVIGLMFTDRRDPAQSYCNVSHILISVNGADPNDRARGLEKIKEIQAKLAAGESFGALAREYSDDPTTKNKGGALGAQARGVYQENFENAVWSQEIGVVGDVVGTTFGFHLVLVHDRNISEADKYEAELDRKAREMKDNDAQPIIETPTE